MCDTFIAGYDATGKGIKYFAKNSDREPNEAQILVVCPAEKKADKKLKTTFVEIEQVKETYGVFLSKPYHIWGGEMGVNECGVSIGNEALFTKDKPPKEGLIGMDILRAALERGSTADEAATVIIELIERYGQGGNCGFESPMYYNNSFLIVDFDKSIIIESTGKKWIVKNVEDSASISNTLTIDNDYCAISKNIPTGEKNKIDDKGFRKTYSDILFTKFSKGYSRHKTTLNEITKKHGFLELPMVFDILRKHKEDDIFSMESICEHYGNLISTQTTSSMVVVYDNKNRQFVPWATGSSAPCISIFKPWLFDWKKPGRLDEKNSEQLLDFWLKRELFYRSLLDNFENKLTVIDSIRPKYEEKYLEMINNSSENELVNNSQAILSIEADFYSEAGDALSKLKGPKSKMTIIQRRNWTKASNRLKNIYKNNPVYSGGDNS